VDPKRFINIRKADIKKKLGLYQFDYVLGTVGRLVEAKAYYLMIDALSLIRDNSMNFVFLFVGDGELREELKQRTLEKKLGDRILFLGWRSDIPEILGAMDVFVISSIREGLPVSMLESMAAKVPVVATSVGGIPEVIRDGENGLLVPPNDSGKLAEKLLYLLNGPEYGRTLAHTAYQDILKKYSIQYVTKEIERIYLELFNSKNHSFNES
jgi:glycosyltransferase involved in cell wall biosynthesis